MLGILGGAGHWQEGSAPALAASSMGCPAPGGGAPRQGHVQRTRPGGACCPVQCCLRGRSPAEGAARTGKQALGRLGSTLGCSRSRCSVPGGRWGSGASPGAMRWPILAGGARGPRLPATWESPTSPPLSPAITRDRVPEWVEFVALWLPIGSGFLNCFVYFWTNRSFRHKWRRLTRELCGPCRGGGAGRQPGPAGPRTLSAAVERRDGQRGFSPEPSCSASSASILLPLEMRTAV